MPWWVLPVLVGLGSVAGGARFILRGRRVAASGDPGLAVHGAALTVMGTMLVTSGVTAAAAVAMLSYALR